MGVQLFFFTAHRVQNASGPSAPPLSPLEQLQHDLNPPPSSWNRFKSSRGVVSSSALLGLTERVSNIEQFTHLYGGMYDIVCFKTLGVIKCEIENLISEFCGGTSRDVIVTINFLQEARPLEICFRGYKIWK